MSPPLPFAELMFRLAIFSFMLVAADGTASAQDFTQAAPTASVQTTPQPQNTQAGDANWLAKQKNQTLGTAATAPLDDFNLRQQAIPPILTAAALKPFDLQGLNTCASLSDAVVQLTDVLGDDIDASSEAKASMGEKARDMADSTAIGTVRATTTGIIPFRGWVRKLSGAERHQKEVDAAITAGQERRAFLKGVGLQRNCAPPAAPAGFVPAIMPEPKAPTSKAPASKAPVRHRKAKS